MLESNHLELSIFTKMPNIKKEISKGIDKCKHPNSRKTLALTKQIKKLEVRKKIKTGQYIKQNITAEKVLWFRDNLPSTINSGSAGQIEELIEKYLSRFDEELAQIAIKHSVGNRKNRQHASREDIINMTKKNEQEEFNTCGLEIPDILNEKNLQVLLKWNGELRYLSHIKLRRYTKKFLQQKNNDTKNLNCKTDSEKSDLVNINTKPADLMDTDS